MPHTGDSILKAAPDLGLRGLELFDRIIEEIEAHPEHWNQDSWAKIHYLPAEVGRRWIGNTLPSDVDLAPECGTTMCAAGWAAHLCGVRIVFRVYADTDATFRAYAGAVVTDSPLDGEPISDFAQRMLGLSDELSRLLFFDAITLADIKNIRNEFAWELQEVDNA